MHGGAAPQVKAKAAERLAAMVHPALDQLLKLLTAESEMVSLQAVKEVLERTMAKKEAMQDDRIDELKYVLKQAKIDAQDQE